MPYTPDLLVLAVTHMRGGVCVAGMIPEAHPASGLRWVRPVKQHAALLPGDIRYANGRLMALGDVVRWPLAPANATAPHVEDALVNPIRDRPQLLRKLDAGRRAQFCAEHLDQSADDVLRLQTRSLCIIRPTRIRATWHADQYNGRYEARIAFEARGFATSERGFPVTDLAWRALGRRWLAGAESLDLGHTALHDRLGPIYLVIGLGREFEGRHWPLVVGVHASAMPDVQVDDFAH